MRAIMQGVGDSRHSKTIDILTDNVLLEIFDFYRRSHGDTLWEWTLLVQVCQRWRQIIFQSPHRLDLKIRCAFTSPVRESLGIWPAFPIAIDFGLYWIQDALDSFPVPDGAIAAFEHNDRVGYLKLSLKEVPSGQFATFLASMASKPFPVLTHLIIDVQDKYGHLQNENFLRGPAPRLRVIHLRGITFSALQKLLLSASDLVELQLSGIPSTGHISPVAMAMCLANFPRLETFVLLFRSITSLPGPIRPPVTRNSILPALTKFEFRGSSQYLEDFIAHIDCPRLNQSTIIYMNGCSEFQVAQLTSFLNRSLGTEISPPFRRAKVLFGGDVRTVAFHLYRSTNRIRWDLPATALIGCRGIDWNIFHTLNKFSTTLSTVVYLKIVGEFWGSHPSNDEYNLEWLHYLHRLSALQALYVSLPLAEKIGHALKSIKGDVVAKALPFLVLICLQDQESSIEEFVSVRKLSDFPLTVVSTEAEFDQRLGER